MDSDYFYVVVVENSASANDGKFKLTVIDVNDDGKQQKTENYNGTEICHDDTTFTEICDQIFNNVSNLERKQKKEKICDLYAEIKEKSVNAKMKLEDFVEDDLQNVLTVWTGKTAEPSLKEPMRQDSKLFTLFRDTLLKNERRNPEPLDITSYVHSEGSFMCSYCDHSTSNEKGAIRHYRFRHGPRNHYCLACKSTYRRHDYLLKHESLCQANNADVLRKARKFIGTRRKIRLTNSKTRKGPCPLCGKMICQRNMKAHLNVHSSVPRYACEDCPARFRTPRSLTAHSRAHRGLRPYRCDQCPKAYTSDSAFYAHMLEHRSQAFICDFCGRRFFRKYSLKQHMTIHSGQARYLCQQCGRSFSNKSSLVQHRRKHNGSNTRYNCMDCIKSFSKISVLKAHLNKKHGLDIVTRKMFFNQLPKMTDSALKVAMNGKESIINYKLEQKDEADVQPRHDANVHHIQPNILMTPQQKYFTIPLQGDIAELESSFLKKSSVSMGSFSFSATRKFNN